MKRQKKIKMTYEWPDGQFGQMMVEPALLGFVYQAIRDKSHVSQIRCNGLTYQEYVRQFGGLVVAA